MTIYINDIYYIHYSTRMTYTFSQSVQCCMDCQLLTSCCLAPDRLLVHVSRVVPRNTVPRNRVTKREGC